MTIIYGLENWYSRMVLTATLIYPKRKDWFMLFAPTGTWDVFGM